jgi:hypothetical protein
MLSVPVSEFFRDPPVWKYLREQVIPELDSFPRINIWQVGCGYGQESYSLAILLHECGLAYKARMITTDISSDLLARARRGRWPATSSRSGAPTTSPLAAAPASTTISSPAMISPRNETHGHSQQTACKRSNSSSTIWSPTMPSSKRSC